MKSTISDQQNQPQNLRLLIAQRHIYSRAKQYRKWQMYVIIGLAVISPLFLFLPDTWKLLAGTLGIIWTVLSVLVLGRLEDEKLKQAATIQEQFDTGLYNLPWNSILADTRITPELISEANQDFKGNSDDLKNWYGDLSKITHPLDVLLCQRSNLVWDWRLRRVYAISVSFLTSGYLVLGGIALYFPFHQSLRDILLAWLLPSLSAFIEGARLASKQFGVAAEKQALEKKIVELWAEGLKQPAWISQDVLRQIQDRIYGMRAESPPIPDWFNDRFHKKYEANMHDAIKEYQAQAEAASTSI